MMINVTYERRRGELETYFDRTASQAWARLTSDAPVSRIRATVRAGRDEMRATLLGWLPADLTGCRLLDAGCGTAALKSSPSISPAPCSTSPAPAFRRNSRIAYPSFPAICSIRPSAISTMSWLWTR
jgi:hypothetical protein